MAEIHENVPTTNVGIKEEATEFDRSAEAFHCSLQLP